MITDLITPQASTFIQKPISETEKLVRLRLMQCKLEGSTALGPGALTAILLAKEHQLGSNIVICTDGAANIGPYGDEFYTKMGKLAANNGVTVNLIAFVGA